MIVLIVDDEIYMVDYIRKLIEWEKYGFEQILTAHGGSRARDLLQEYQPDLLITDIKMPKISGIDLAQTIRENKYKTKVIILSGYSDFTYAKQALRYGVSEYLVKPILKAEFIETLERVIEQIGKGSGYEQEEQESNGGASWDKKAIITYIKEYINENFHTNLTLEIIGELVHLHPSYLSKVFKEMTGINLSSYITDVRMEKAAELMEQTNLKVYDVMERIGYQKSQHFSKLFKEKYGVTPNEYRRRIR